MRIDTNVLIMIARQSLYGNEQHINIMDYFAPSKTLNALQIIHPCGSFLCKSKREIHINYVLPFYFVPNISMVLPS